ncbi:MAG TPA: hypothetical protein DDY43_15170 [Synechococcales bacterium UBA10510]|nr:hypothetical protein [Synechococcales bacterium UBA10510]
MSAAADAPRSFNSVVLPHAVDPGNEYPVKMLKYLLFEFAGVQQGRFLDLGGGWGAYTKIALDLGFDAISIDREPAAEGVPHHICDLKHGELPIESSSIDIVFSKSVIEHFYLHEIPHLMSEILRVLKPGGALLLMTPDWESNTKSFYQVFTHVTPYTRSSLAQCLKMYGFKNVSSKQFVQLPSVWHSAFARLMAKLTYYAPLPKSFSKWVRWSKELSLVGVGYKSCPD